MSNNKVLITGASGGIGKALCEKFIESSAKIICTSSDAEKLKKNFLMKLPSKLVLYSS